MTNEKLTSLFAGLLFAFSGEVALGYEVNTHAIVSEAAVNASSLNETLSAFGISSSDPLDIGSIRQSLVNNGSPMGWVQEGSILEDDTFTEAFMRYKNHFFNPLNNAGYSYLGLTGIPAPDWGLEDTASYSNQLYSLKRAREYLYQGLTLADPTDRKRSLAKTFRALGQVGHLLQDMAQPQHTRNDSHGGYILGPTSLYEAYTEEVRKRLPLSGYAPVYSSVNAANFADARSLWTQASGVGLAQFSNWNFVSAGTNFDNSGMFNFPLFDPAKRVDMDIQAMCASANPPCPNPALTGIMTFYGTTVEDRITGQKTLNPLASTESLFDADLQKAASKRAFTLNRFNFDMTNGFVIPRAVGYSAGLINYFFRGKIDFGFNPADPTKYLVRNLGTEPMSGTFSVYYDGVDGTRYPVKRADQTDLEWSTAGVLHAGEALSVPVFSPPRNPAPQTPGTYVIVFKGDMGQETAANGTIGALAATESNCVSNTQSADYPPVAFTGDGSYESLPVAWLSRDADGKLFLDGYIWIKKNPVPPPSYQCFPGPMGCIWYLAYPPSPYLNTSDSTGDRYDPTLQSANEFVKVWIDLNGDKDFSSDELVLEKSYSPYLVAGSWYSNQLITLHEPLNITPGNACQTGMRIAMRWNTSPTGPNDNFPYGTLSTDQVQLR